jgi:hypothetical protein
VAELWTLGDMTQRITTWRLWPETAVFVATVFAFTIVSAWCDPDVPFKGYWFLTDFGVGLLFGIFGRCPILFMAPSAGLVFVTYSIYWTVIWICIGVHSFVGLCDEWGFEMFCYGFMILPLLVGAVIGRGTKRWMINLSFPSQTRDESA